MKKLMTTNIILYVFFIAVVSTKTVANNDKKNDTGSSTKEESSISMQFEVPSNVDAYVLVLDQKGNAIHTDIVDKDAYVTKRYDFSKVRDGVYTFITESDHKSVEKTLIVNNSELKVVNEESAFRPVFSV